MPHCGIRVALEDRTVLHWLCCLLALCLLLGAAGCAPPEAPSWRSANPLSVKTGGLCSWKVMPAPIAREVEGDALWVADFLTDGEGRLWIATDAGIFVADSPEIAEPLPGWIGDHEPFAEGATFALALDPAGQVWRGTREGRLSYESGGGWQPVAGEPGELDIGDADIGALAFGPDGSLWVGYGMPEAPAGAAAVARRTLGGSWAVYTPTQVFGTETAFVTALAFDPQGGLWVAGESVVHLDGERWRRFPIAGPVHDLVVLSDQIWVGTAAGLQRYAGGRWQTLEASGPIFSLAVDSVDYVWAAGGTSISRYRPDGGLDRLFLRGDGMPISLEKREDTFERIYVGSSDTVWLANGGLRRILRCTWLGGIAVAPTPTVDCHCNAP